MENKTSIRYVIHSNSLGENTDRENARYVAAVQRAVEQRFPDSVVQVRISEHTAGVILRPLVQKISFPAAFRVSFEDLDGDHEREIEQTVIEIAQQIWDSGKY